MLQESVVYGQKKEQCNILLLHLVRKVRNHAQQFRLWCIVKIGGVMNKFLALFLLALIYLFSRDALSTNCYKGYCFDKRTIFPLPSEHSPFPGQVDIFGVMPKIDEANCLDSPENLCVWATARFAESPD